MSTRYLISDLHFGHKSIIGFTSRGKVARTIEEHDALLIDNWNSTVTNRDSVYVLGDVAWSATAALSCLPQLQGQKFLVGGNHDSWRWIRHDFEKVYGVKEFGDIVLTHIPIHPQELYTLKRRWEFNIHGHLHDDYVLKADGSPDPNYINVCCEQVALRPIPFDEVIALARQRRDSQCFESPTPWRSLNVK